jgi:LmbE family N-acetylglucosaminyl deacetylase
MQIKDIIHKSIIIAAHPDDEILWFSSIIDKVDQIIICFVGQKSKPDWTKGRKVSLEQYPLKNMSYLGLDVSEIFGGTDWQNPVATDIGINIVNQRISPEKYQANFPVLRNAIKEKISGYQNVITHNPWGEYGHEEHVQLYRAVKSLQAEMGFSIWFSNYCSYKSLVFMSKYASGFNSEPLTLKTNKTISNDIAKIYKKNGCWTWYDGYQWPDEETFIKENIVEEKNLTYGKIFPLNMIHIKIEPVPRPVQKKNIFARSKRKLKRLWMQLSIAE